MRTTIVSLTQLKRYKNQLIAIGVFILSIGLIIGSQVIFDGEYSLMFNMPLIILVPILLYKEYNKMRSIAYDAHSLYYGSIKSPELHKVPFDKIRSIHLGKFDRIYKINFTEPIDGVKAVYFKPSPIWGSFSNIKYDRKVNRLCDAINTHFGIADPEQQLQIYKVASVS